jgi:hypothetical protein
MKARLLFPDHDFDPKRPLPWNADALTRDLALDTVFQAMARKDDFVLEVAKQALFQGVENDASTIVHRQNLLRDGLAHPELLRQLYALAEEAVEIQRRHWLGSLSRFPSWTLNWGVGLLGDLLSLIRRLRDLVDAQSGASFGQEWSAFFSMIQSELSDDYLESLVEHLKNMKFEGGVMFSSRLGDGDRSVEYVLHRPPAQRFSWFERIFPPKQPGFGFDIHPRDEAGARALEDLRARGIASISQTVGQSADHVRSFFHMLRVELAFYVGCLNLHEDIAQRGAEVCFPDAAPAEVGKLSFRGLYDLGLALRQEQPMVGNDADADGRALVLVTGANQGGKSTFLRSVGVAQLMLQAGMFVPAQAMSASVRDGVFTHYKREEDLTLNSGKLDEELGRMSEIVDHLTPRPLILFNESFAATNEREGSEIARQILSALLEKPVTIVCVTHLYELAHDFAESGTQGVLFLRADRRDDGSRTFHLVEGEPLRTSFGDDLYRNVFGEVPGRAEAASQRSHAAREGLPSPG